MILPIVIIRLLNWTWAFWNASSKFNIHAALTRHVDLYWKTVWCSYLFCIFRYFLNMLSDSNISKSIEMIESLIFSVSVLKKTIIIFWWCINTWHECVQITAINVYMSSNFFYFIILISFHPVNIMINSISSWAIEEISFSLYYFSLLLTTCQSQKNIKSLFSSLNWSMEIIFKDS